MLGGRAAAEIACMATQMMPRRVDGSALKRRRLEAGFSRERLGAAAGGIASATVVRVERGEVSPHPSTVAALAAALGCVPEDLLEPQDDHDPGASRAAEEVGEGAARPSG